MPSSYNYLIAIYFKKLFFTIDKYNFLWYTCKVIWFTCWRKIMFEKNLNISLLLDFYGDILSDRQNEMLNLYYNEDCSLAEIAENFSISRQGVRSVLKKGENILKEMEEKLQLVSRFIKMRDISSEVAIELESINSMINNDDISSKIHSIVNKIKEMANY